MLQKQETTLQSKHNQRPFLLDYRYKSDAKPKPIVLFVHGFKGFKDWGTFDFIANLFAEAGFFYAKMNLSHNGTTIDKPYDFADLDAFGKNNYIIELDDVETVIDYLMQLDIPSLLKEELYLIGHSRGGGLMLLKAREDTRVKKVASWAGVGTFSIKEPQDRIEHWKKEGVVHVWNGRTEQNMPLYYQLYETLMANYERLDIGKAVAEISKPILLVHGTEDPTVPYKAAVELKEGQANVQLLSIEGADHTFGGGHPFKGNELPPDLNTTVEATIAFFKK